jgi:Icc-related predicted phosphoesterase
VVAIAAVGDVHFGLDAAGTLRPQLEDLSSHASLLLLAGDLTRHGEPSEARVLGEELSDLGVPVIVTLGNHDHHTDQHEELAAELRSCGLLVLDGDSARFDIDGCDVAVIGEKGFGGGFAGRCGTEFGERAMKDFIRCTKASAARLESSLAECEDADVRIVLLHYAPVPDTCVGEPLEIYPFLGSYLLAEAIDAHMPDLVLHGHAHHGSPRGVTAGGVPVRNVAQPLIRAAYARFELDGRSGAADSADQHAAAAG